MTTTNAKAECVPGIWKNWWNAFVNCFKRDAVCTRSAVRQPAPKLEDGKVQDKEVSSKDMKAASDLKDRVLEFSRIYFGEAEQGEDFMAHAWSGSTDSSLETERRQVALSSASKSPFSAWGGSPGWGIPELASPLAD